MRLYRRVQRWLLAALVLAYAARLVWLTLGLMSHPPHVALAQDAPTPTRVPIIRATAGPAPGSAPQPVVTATSATSGAPAAPPPVGAPIVQPTVGPVGQPPSGPGGQLGPRPVGQQPTATVLAAPPGPVGQPQGPGQAPGVIVTPRPPAGQATQVFPATATPFGAGTPATSGTPAAPVGTAAPPAPLGALQTLSGTIVAVDALVDAPAVVIRVDGGRGTITVNPGPNTAITRDGQTVPLSMLDLGDRVTVLIDQQERPLRLTVTTQPESDLSQVIWEALLGLVMMGVVLIIDQDLRVKFMAALLEPAVEYSAGPR